MNNDNTKKKKKRLIISEAKIKKEKHTATRFPKCAVIMWTAYLMPYWVITMVAFVKIAVRLWHQVSLSTDQQFIVQYTQITITAKRTQSPLDRDPIADFTVYQLTLITERPRTKYGLWNRDPNTGQTPSLNRRPTRLKYPCKPENTHAGNVTANRTLKQMDGETHTGGFLFSLCRNFTRPLSPSVYVAASPFLLT